MLEKEIKYIKAGFLGEFRNSSNERALYGVKIKYIGRNGQLTKILKKLRELAPKERKIIGSLANETRKEIEKEYEKRKKELGEQIDWEKEKIDITLPGRKSEIGSLHPITLVYREIEKIFSSMGFEIAEGPELETDWYNFPFLNFPFDHPARDMQDTFWIHPLPYQKGRLSINKYSEGAAASLSVANLLKSEDGVGEGAKSPKDKLVLRTHTSPVQVRYMEKRQPPFRIIVPGRVFRNEATDAAHEHTLHQFEALVVGDDVNIGHFKYVAKQFFSAFFGKEVDIRLRP